MRVASRTLCLIALAWAGCLVTKAQEWTVFNRAVQVHGFSSQGFVRSDENNWLTMNTSDGSFSMTDGGVNASSQITQRLRVGAQVYDRNIGHIGQWRPELDFAYADYRFAEWLGVRGGKVKTTLGLYNNTQDVNFLHTWAILPQSIYPTDLRAATISHVGGDIYGAVKLKRLGRVSYTAYAGERPQDPRGGYVLGIAAIGITYSNYGGWMQGDDLRWETPLKGLTVGTSYLNQHITGDAVYNPANAVDPFLTPLNLPLGAKSHEYSLKDPYLQYYLDYTSGRFHLDAEYRREYRLQQVGYTSSSGVPLANFTVPLDQRSWYGSVAYRLHKRVELGSYLSWYIANAAVPSGPPVDHVYDRDVTARFDVSSHSNIKVEGHFINGYGRFDSIRGFYEQYNPGGLKPETNFVVVKTGFDF